MEHVWELDVIHKGATTRYKFRIFEALDWLADVVHLVPPCP
jgi:hypothetical protein